MWLGLWTLISFPGLTLAPGASSGVIDFSDGYRRRRSIRRRPIPAMWKFRSKAVQGINSMSGSIFTENDVSTNVVTAAEASAIMMLLIAFGGLLLIRRIFGRLKLVLSFGNF
jgi:hypothetical protein